MFSFSVLYILITISVTVFAQNFNSDCGQVFTEKQFIIQSLNFPNNYPTNYQCLYLIKGPSCPSYFSLQLLDFDVEDSFRCSKDRLEIADKAVLCGNGTNEVKYYFSEKGTLLLKFVSDNDVTDRGYKILITRSSCQNVNTTEATTQQVPKWYTTNNDVEYTPTTKRTSYDTNKGKCCQAFYNSKQFIVISPNFPYSMSTATDCVYEIHKTNTNICRLRIHVNFFWLGRSNADCPEGFLEIDGKYFCGCKSELKIISPFDGQPKKRLRFFSKGNERSSYSGFVMEIIQDECPKKFVPENDDMDNSVGKSFKFYNDQINRVSWPNKSHEVTAEKLHLISENTEVISDEYSEKSSPQVIRHFYFYGYPNYNREPRDREETEYVDTSSVSTSFVKDTVDYNYCRNWNQMQFNILPLRNLPVCKSSEGNVVESKCIELNQLRGHFKSPGYPFYYPGNVNICYRFHKLPGYCSFRIYMKDFNLQTHVTCENDYLLFVNKLRYCGSSLVNTISTLDLRNKPYGQMNFITDGYYCGRGFFGSYEQLPCQESSYPVNPTSPPPETSCSKTIQDRVFTLDVYDYNGPTCIFTIKKYSEDVCTLRLYFEKFDLICASESLVVDGTMYCGRMTGKTVEVDITNRNPTIVYRKAISAGINGLRFHIRGELVDCPEPEVPAERILSSDAPAERNWEDNTQFVLKIGRHLKDICGVITNSTEVNLPQTFCDFIMKYHNNNVTNCLPLKGSSLFVPYESQKLELKIRDVEKTQEVEFREVDCDDESMKNF